MSIIKNYSELETKEDSLEQILRLSGLPDKFKLRAFEFNLVRAKINHLKYLLDNLELTGGEGIAGLEIVLFRFWIGGFEPSSYATYLNNKNSFEVLPGQIPKFRFLISLPNELPKITSYSIRGEQQGIFGQDGSRLLTEADLSIDFERNASADDLEEQSETQIVTFPNISGNIEDWLQLQDPVITIQPQDDGLVVFRGKFLGRDQSYFFVGPRGNYGVDADNTALAEHFEPLKEFDNNTAVQGADGSQGDIGPRGNPGDQGNDGSDGADGSQGAQGDIGPRGPQGDQGAQGNDGAVGPRGPQGDIGPRGNPGDQGNDGSDGADGSQGAQGDIGPRGNPGDQGNDGSDGADGSQGAQGDIGPRGPQGDQGAQGNDGAVGPRGPQGADGDQDTNPSDMRLKEKIKVISNPIYKIKSLSGFTYNWNQLAVNKAGFKKDYRLVGVSANDIQKVLPEVVKLAPFDTNDEGKSISGENYLSVNYDKIVPLLIEGIKDQQKQIDSLKQEIYKLKSLIKNQ
jgi:hypothetical protein